VLYNNKEKFGKEQKEFRHGWSGNGNFSLPTFQKKSKENVMLSKSWGFSKPEESFRQS
jgi:hypothetical protein